MPNMDFKQLFPVVIFLQSLKKNQFCSEQL